MNIQLHDKTFEPYISEEAIQSIIAEMSEKLEALKEANPHFIVVLNGSFLFAADLLKKLSYDAEVSFIKLSSYKGTSTSGTVKEILGLQADITNKTIVVLEDIIDTGITLEKIYALLKKENPKEIQIATLLFKPTAFQKDLPIHYIGQEIPNEFVVGYGLDYEELGRTLPQIYKLKNN
jgi:hypoxanthine phosphoribosyltransferase